MQERRPIPIVRPSALDHGKASNKNTKKYRPKKLETAPVLGRGCHEVTIHSAVLQCWETDQQFVFLLRPLSLGLLGARAGRKSERRVRR